MSVNNSTDLPTTTTIDDSSKLTDIFFTETSSYSSVYFDSINSDDIRSVYSSTVPSIVSPSYSNLDSAISDSISSQYTSSLIFDSSLSISTSYEESKSVQTEDLLNPTLSLSSSYYTYVTNTVSSTFIIPSSPSVRVQPITRTTTRTGTSTNTSTMSASTSSSEILFLTSLATSTSFTPITYTYDQVYYITGRKTSFTTDMIITKTFMSDSEATSTTYEPITTDLAFYNAHFSGVTQVSNTEKVDDTKRNTIIGSVVGSIFGIGIVLFLMWFFFFKKRKARQTTTEMGFSHSIASTRINQYNSTDYNDDDHYFNSELDYPKCPLPVLAHTNSSNSVISDEHGLKSLRNSILQDQILDDSKEFNNQYYTMQKQRYNPRLSDELERKPVFETLQEENESDYSSFGTIQQTTDQIHQYSKAINSSRYKNAGLQLNSPISTSLPIHSFQGTASPFDDPITVRRAAPTPPPSRKPTQNHSIQDLNTWGENRRSVDSSVISDETDLSTDDSLLQPDGTLGNGNNGIQRGGFFKEFV